MNSSSSPITDRIIVCIGSSWNYDPTSKHHIMSELSKYNDIVWVEYHGTRRPKASLHDLRSAWSALRRMMGGRSWVKPRILRVTPVVVPGARHRMVSAIHHRLLTKQIRSAVRAVPEWSAKPVQIWSFAPDVPFLIGSCDEECFVYYCTDDYIRFEGFDSERIRTYEEEMLERADLVVTTSEALWKAKRARRADAVLMRHGVDFDHFAAAWRNPPPRPDDLAKISNPLFGFFGLLHHWIDVALLAELARQRPQYSFVLIGESKVDVSELRCLSNVHLLGRRAYADLPAYCATFSAGLLPFTRHEMTRSINPIKMYEYLAAGLPILSTPLPEAERFRGPVRFGETAREFAEACDAVLEAPQESRGKTISDYVEIETWESKVAELGKLVHGKTHLRGFPMAGTACKTAVVH
ncbi:MAG: glycosyltransferase [Planctomycetota bacterium]